MNKRITLQRREEVLGPTGQPSEQWADVARVWASIQPIVGREYFNASGERAEITHEVNTRAQFECRPQDRIMYGERVFNIRSALNVDERGRYLRLMVVENAN